RARADALERRPRNLLLIATGLLRRTARLRQLRLRRRDLLLDRGLHRAELRRRERVEHLRLVERAREQRERLRLLRRQLRRDRRMLAVLQGVGDERDDGAALLLRQRRQLRLRVGGGELFLERRGLLGDVEVLDAFKSSADGGEVGEQALEALDQRRL